MPTVVYDFASVSRLLDAKRKVLARLDAQQYAQQLFDSLNSPQTAPTAQTALLMAPDSHQVAVPTRTAEDLNIVVAGYGGLTFQNICDTIVAAKILTKEDGVTHPTALEIFNAEEGLQQVLVWFDLAKQTLAFKNEPLPYELPSAAPANA